MFAKTLGRFAAVFALALLVVSCSAGAAPPATQNPGPPPPMSRPVAQADQMCAGIAGIRCAEGLSCMMAPGQCRTVADAAGTCRAMPPMCTREYRPVCGCDGKTYGNACTAGAAGVSVAAQGECKA